MGPFLLQPSSHLLFENQMLKSISIYDQPFKFYKIGDYILSFYLVRS